VTRAAYRPHASMIFSFRDKGPAIVTLAPGPPRWSGRLPGDRFLLETREYRGKPLSLRGDRVRVEQSVREIPSQVDLEDAEVIVAGGKGMQAGENFGLLAGPGRGAGRDRGRLANRGGFEVETEGVHGRGDRKVVSPGLYVACGISGAIQHMMGMPILGDRRGDQHRPERPHLPDRDAGHPGGCPGRPPVMIDAFRKAAAESDRPGAIRMNATDPGIVVTVAPVARLPESRGPRPVAGADRSGMPPMES